MRDHLRNDMRTVGARLHLSLMAVLLFMGCATPSGFVEEPRPAVPDFESTAFFNSLVNRPEPDLKAEEAVGGSSATVESGHGKSQ